MTPSEIEHRMRQVISDLKDASALGAELQRQWRVKTLEAERAEAGEFLRMKAIQPRSVEELKRDTKLNPTVHQAWLDAILSESDYKRQQGLIRALENEFEMLRSLMGIERVLIDKGIELGDHTGG